MFTGIVTHLGRVRRIARSAGGARLEIESALPAEALETGASVAHDGVCLTVVETGADGAARWHAADVSAETLACATLGEWEEGRTVNLEAAARFGDPIGGHVVTGHVDAPGEVVSVTPEGDSLRIEIAAPQSLARFIAPKGSVAMDGVSLTVNAVADDPSGGARFGVNIIPHTAQATTLGAYAPGRRVNLEIDPLARYVARLADAAPHS